MLWGLSKLASSQPGVNCSILIHILQCPRVAVLRIKQNHGCWEVDVVGRDLGRCFEAMSYACKPLKEGLRCRIMGRRLVANGKDEWAKETL